MFILLLSSISLNYPGTNVMIKATKRGQKWAVRIFFAKIRPHLRFQVRNLYLHLKGAIVTKSTGSRMSISRQKKPRVLLSLGLLCMLLFDIYEK